MLEELFVLQYHGKMSLGDAQKLPIYQREWFLERTLKEMKMIKEKVDQSKSTSNIRKK